MGFDDQSYRYPEKAVVKIYWDSQERFQNLSMQEWWHHEKDWRYFCWVYNLGFTGFCFYFFFQYFKDVNSLSSGLSSASFWLAELLKEVCCNYFYCSSYIMYLFFYFGYFQEFSLSLVVHICRYFQVNLFHIQPEYVSLIFLDLEFDVFYYSRKLSTIISLYIIMAILSLSFFRETKYTSVRLILPHTFRCSVFTYFTFFFEFQFE